MIAQFRNRYPNGSLISELLAIDHGKYIVRVLLQVEEVILATGLAAAETVELAEDQARQRALDILGPGIVIPPSQPTTSVDSDLPTPIPLREETALTESSGPVFTEAQPNMTVPATDESISTLSPESGSLPQSLPSEDWLSATYLSPDKGKQKSNKDSQAHPSSAKVSSASLPPLPSNSADVSGNVPVLPEDLSVSPIPIRSSVRSMESQDFSSDIAKTDIQLQRLGWTNEQGVAHLKKTYGKRSRSHLTEEELLDFLNYLESLDTPISQDQL